MMIRPNSVLLAVSLAALAHPVFAAPDEARVLAAVRKAYPGTKVDRAERTPMPGVYEIWMGGNVAFVSIGDPRYMVFGRLVDLKTMRDLTASKLRNPHGVTGASTGGPELPAVYKGVMPVSDAITVVRGDGRRVVSVFTDPACGFCRQLESQLQQLKDVTIHYYLLPFQGSEAPMAIWCAKDRVTAYVSAMADPVPPDLAPANCSHPLDRNRTFAAKLRVMATPTMVFSDGVIVPGVMSSEELEARLDGEMGDRFVKEGGNHAKPTFKK